MKIKTNNYVELENTSNRYIIHNSVEMDLKIHNKLLIQLRKLLISNLSKDVKL